MPAGEPKDPKSTDEPRRPSELDPDDRKVDPRDLRPGTSEDTDIDVDSAADEKKGVRRLASDETDEEELAEEDILADAELDDRGEGPDA